LIAAGLISLASLAVVAQAPAQDTAASGPTGVSGATSTSGSSGTTGGGAASGLPTRIVRLPPATLSSGVADLTIKLNGSAQGGGPDPTLEPSVPGAWTSWGQNETFKPTSSFAPCGTYTLTIPAGTAAAGEASLGKSQKFSFTIACPSVKALQEALARLGYLPYRLESFAGVDLNVPLTTGMAAARAYALPAGWLRRRYREAPALAVGTMDPTTTGALWVWEEDHDIPVGTQPDAAIWRSLVREEALDHTNPRPYTWVTVTENTSPELLKVHEGRHVVITSPTNTGIPGRTTQTGEFPIYVRYVATTMSGTNPDGSHYDDPGVPWVNYFNGGDAVHGFPRASYGFPQSLGCVELPIPTAEKVYDQLAVGDMVDVSD
jgi:hypothetical protein